MNSSARSMRTTMIASLLLALAAAMPAAAAAASHHHQRCPGQRRPGCVAYQHHQQQNPTWRTAASAPLQARGNAHLILTNAGTGQELAAQPDLQFTSAPAPGATVIGVNDAVTYQRITGVGAALTDSSAWLIHSQLPAQTSTQLMNALFGPGGIHLNFLRVPIGASDFTVGRTPYSYDDLPAGQRDPRLASFSVAHDEAYIIPTLRQALALNPGAMVLASLWSPPAWMKDNGDLANLNGSGGLLAGNAESLAQYFIKFLQAYDSQGARITAVTPQNEPGIWTAYPGMNFSESNEAAFVRYRLAPALAAAHLTPDIYGYDGGWAAWDMPFATQLATGRSSAALTGMATHCYFGSPRAISALHQANPKLNEIVSECSPGITPFSTSELEISSMRNWASTVALWNLALDPQGQPVQPPNTGCPGCSGVVTINPQAQTWTPTIDYYELGQLSKYVRPGAVRIDTPHFVTYSYPGNNGNVATTGLDDVAFRNPDGTEVLLAYNSAPTAFSFALKSHRRYVSYQLAPQATATVVWKVGR